MAAQSKEDKVEAQREKDALDAVNSATVAEAEAAAAANLREQARVEAYAANTNELEPESGVFEGQIATSKDYVASTAADLGQAFVELKYAGQVGPGLRIPARRVEQVKTLLGQLKNLPEQEK